MGTTFTRQQLWAMERNAEGVDRATESDRKFFLRFPARSYRVRAMAPPEIAQLSVILGGPLERLNEGEAWFFLMRQLAPGLRFKVPRPGPMSKVGDEVSEATARTLYDEHLALYPLARAREADMIAAARKPGGPLHPQEGGLQE